MAKHEFGMMPAPPAADKRYDEYEPQRYHCIALDDEAVERLDPCWQRLPVYWHTLAVPGNGLAYCGVTLIPPESLETALALMPSGAAYQELRDLLQTAQAGERWIIHFGI